MNTIEATTVIIEEPRKNKAGLRLTTKVTRTSFAEVLDTKHIYLERFLEDGAVGCSLKIELELLEKIPAAIKAYYKIKPKKTKKKLVTARIVS